MLDMCKPNWHDGEAGVALLGALAALGHPRSEGGDGNGVRGNLVSYLRAREWAVESAPLWGGGYRCAGPGGHPACALASAVEAQVSADVLAALADPQADAAGRATRSDLTRHIVSYLVSRGWEIVPDPLWQGGYRCAGASAFALYRGLRDALCAQVRMEVRTAVTAVGL